MADDRATRYQVVSQVRAFLLAGCLTLAVAIRKVIRLPHFDHRGRSVSLSERSVYRWVAAYERDGLRGLEPQPRAGVEGSALSQHKKLDEQASIPEIIECARLQGVGPCRRAHLPTRTYAASPIPTG